MRTVQTMTRTGAPLIGLFLMLMMATGCDDTATGPQATPNATSEPVATKAVPASGGECKNETVGAVTIRGSIQVPDDATCTLDGTEIQGSLEVGSRATVNATNIQLKGNVSASSPAAMVISGSSIGNSISVNEAGEGAEEDQGAIRITGNDIVGDIQLQDNGPSPVYVENNTLAGSIQAQQNDALTQIVGNRLVRNGRPNGQIQCQENDPLVAYDNVAKQLQGQCVNADRPTR